MNLKQRICGFRGHKSKSSKAWFEPNQVIDDKFSHQNGRVTFKTIGYRLVCEKCDYKTRWFWLDERGYAK